MLNATTKEREIFENWWNESTAEDHDHLLNKVLSPDNQNYDWYVLQESTKEFEDDEVYNDLLNEFTTDDDYKDYVPEEFKITDIKNKNKENINESWGKDNIVSIRMLCQAEGLSVLKFFADLYRITGRDPTLTYFGRQVIIDPGRRLSDEEYNKLLSNYGRDIVLEPIKS